MSLLITIIVFSCSENRIYDTYKSIDGQLWHSANSIEFIVNSEDTISANNVFINIRNNKDYAFSSLFLIGRVEFPSGFQVIDTLEYEMTDPQGNWLGSGYSDVKENKLFYKEHVVFNEQGAYTFEIRHATRGINDTEGKLPLAGIVDVGLSIEKIKK